MKLSLKTAAAALALSICSAQAQAATLVFTVTGFYTATWQLDSSPVPSAFGNGVFLVNSVSGTFGGVAQSANINFFVASDGGGLQIFDGGSTLADLLGPQLFSGTLAAPTFITGTFALSDNSTGASASINIAELTTAAVPEPASWAMMLAGFGLVGGALRRGQAGRVRVTKVGYAG